VRTSNHTLLFIRSSAIMLAASAAAVFLSAGTALGQARCPYSISPGQTQFLGAASSADVTPPQVRPVTQAGAAFTDENKVESVALVPLGLPVVSNAIGFAQLNYQFCVSSNPNTPANTSSTIPATVSAQVEWRGILFVLAAIAGGKPSAVITMSLVDLGTDGSAPPITLDQQTPLNSALMPTTIKVVSVGGTVASGSAPVVLSAQIITGHTYVVEFRLTCNASTTLVAYGEGCDFGSDIDSGSSVIDFFTGQRFARVDSLAVNLGQDLYGMLVSIKADVAGLSAQINATRQGVTVGNLTAEQENAQLLGILNEIRSLLTALQSDPPISSTPAKAKTSNPKPPIRPVRPRTMDPP